MLCFILRKKYHKNNYYKNKIRNKPLFKVQDKLSVLCEKKIWIEGNNKRIDK